MNKPLSPIKNIMASAVCTAVSLSTISYASDIEIYQQARSGDITLMMLFDISGSMGAPQLTGNASACDIPNGKTVSGSGKEYSTNGSPSYLRYYCTARADTYKYRGWRDGSNSITPNRWQKCENEEDTLSACVWGAIVSVSPSDLNNLKKTTSGGYTYYYESSDRKYYDRLTRIKDAMFDLLYGNVTKGISAVSDDKVIGLAAYSFNGTGTNGYILMPANRLSDNVTINGVTKTQRHWLLDAVATKLYARGGTPTSNAYAEVASYLLGTKTFSEDELYLGSQGKEVFFTYNLSGQTYYTQCLAWNNLNNDAQCNYWPSESHLNTAARTFNFFPLDMSQYSATNCTVRLKNNASASGTNRSGTCYRYTGPIIRSPNLQAGFNYSMSSSKLPTAIAYQKPQSLNQSNETKKCSGQGIYVLTDGEPSGQVQEQSAMRNALQRNFTCINQSTGTNCTLALSEQLLNNNPSGLKIKTAVVGFGLDFANIPSYDRTKSQEENLKVLGLINTPTKRAAEWGIKGEGGWYSGSSSKDVVDSVNNFINNLSSEIPAVTTGTSTIPVDSLNPVVLQNYAYYPQFQPTPDKTYQSWLGNLKKYNVVEGGILKDKLNNLIVDSSGRLLSNYDLWSPTLNTNMSDADRENAVIGGVKAHLNLRANSATNNVNRTLFTTRDYTASTDHHPTTKTFKKIDLTYVTDTSTKDDPKAGYLMNLLGYDFDPTISKSLTIEQLKLQPELRQIGAVMHSNPILITNQGAITYNANKNIISSENREDYIVFGSTQGLLHVVDAVTGQEKFAFVPNEIIETQYLAFAKPELSNLGTHQLYYGIDAPWTAYTEYVNVNDSDQSYLTVKSNAYGQQGKQFIYGGLRMGGRDYYALDLTDINNPQLKFQIHPTGECTPTNPLGCLGQSWSKPSVGWVNWKGKKKLVMFVGGGYDAGGDDGNAFVNGQRVPYAGYESDTYNQTNKRGAGVYMFDAENGDLLWWASANASTVVPNVASTYEQNMKYSVVSQIRTIDRNADGLIDHLYFGDLGGQVWRIDLNNQAGEELNLFARTPTKILNLNTGTSTTSPRFYEMPAFSTYNENGKIFAVVSIGTGNRSAPLVDYTFGTASRDYDAIYNIYDKDVARQDLLKLIPISNASKQRKYLIADADLLTKNITLQAEGVTGLTANSTKQLVMLSDTHRFNLNQNNLVAPYESSHGWYYKFKSNKLQSEKVMATPIVINNDLYVTTFDSSQDGLSGDCGAGVKGESFMTLFCMPYGQCKSGDQSHYRLNLGVGIVGGAVGAGDGVGTQRVIVANTDTSAKTGNKILEKRYNTVNKLISQYWYEHR